MFRRTLPFASAGLGLALLAFAPAAAAHIRLLEPQARYEITGFDTGIKSCPCGLGGSNRSCNVEQDGSDPDRSTDRVSRFEAGSTITLRFDEYVDHTGSYRVAFDPDGADFADFNSNILVPIVADPPGGEGNTGEGAIWEIEVTLPNMTCTNCTLQLIQAMHGDQTTPVTDPAALSTYYTCVDLELVAPGTLGETPAPGEGTEPEPGEGMEPAAGGETPSTEMPSSGSSNSGSSNSGSASGGMNLGTVPPSGENAPPSSAPAMGNSATGSTTNNGATTPGTGTQALGDVMGGSESSSSSGGCNAAAPANTAGLASLLGLGLVATLTSRRRRARR